MQKFAIITDSCGNLNAALREKYDLHYIPTRFYYKDQECIDDTDWQGVPLKDFYDYLRAGNRILTSQISAVACAETFEKFLQEGYDILSLSASEVLTSCVNVCRSTAEKLLKQYPERKIVCINTTISGGGLALLCVQASKMRAAGKTLEETAAWVEENKKYVNQEGTVEDLAYLKRAGRISASKALLGTLFHVKPIVISDIHGYNVSVEKVKGRQNSLNRTIERVVEKYVPMDGIDVYITQADCPDEALMMKQTLMEKLDLPEERVHILCLNAVMSASVGPGMLGVFFYGKEITYDSKVNG